MQKWLPAIIVGLLIVWLISALIPPADQPGTFAYQDFGRLPVIANGRIQPLDSLARNSLLQLSEKQAVETQPWTGHSPKLAATPWLAEMMFNPAQADTRPVFRIDHPEVKGLLNLPMNADEANGTDGKHYGWAQISGKLQQLQNEARRVGTIESAKRTTYEQAVMRLWNGAITYMRLQNMVEPQNAVNWERELQTFRENLPAGIAAARAQQAKQPFEQPVLDRTMGDLQRFDTMSQFEPPLVVPPAHPGGARDAWQRMGEALMDSARGDSIPAPAIDSYAHMAGAFREGRVGDFNSAVSDYRSTLAVAFGPELNKGSHEHYFNALQPFLKAMVIYLLAGLCAIGFWFAPRRLEWLRRTAFGLVLLALLVHTTGLLFRMFLEGRPPVTNLYSSAIFIGWGACVLGLVLERFWRNSVGLVVSCSIGFTTLIIAHHLSLGGDTMEMMRAVLDTNLWLSTHVVVVTLGYASTFVAGLLAIIYIVFMIVSPAMLEDIRGSLGKMIYGIICFATLFSFVGTVLGGIWADQSWGRFWGWDPKENGALIIVIWNALILHARWGGMVRERGLVILAIGGNIVTSWSWFGVNMLGIGLHSYGFTDAAFRWLVGFVISQVALILIAVLMSLRRAGSGPTPPPALA